MEGSLELRIALKTQCILNIWTISPEKKKQLKKQDYFLDETLTFLFLKH